MIDCIEVSEDSKMRVVIAPDSFKECLSAGAVAKALAEGWRRADPGADLRLLPMADGGEGTVEALVAATGGRLMRAWVSGPLGAPIEAEYGMLGDGRTAVIEMAAASGLPLIPPEARDPARTSTRGTGELLLQAIDRGARRIILGLGGSATNDGGAGFASALGYRLLDAEGRILPDGGRALARLADIDASGRHPALDACEILAACDVDNPLCGPEGASRVYAPQKGADSALVEELDRALCHFGEVVGAELGVPVLETPGAGAAGGLGAGLMAFAGGKLQSGVDLVAEANGLAAALDGADLALTGEGRIDGQSARGKVPAGVARLAQAHGVPVVAVAGTLGTGYQTLYRQGVNAVFSISPGPMPLAKAIEDAEANLRDTAEAIARLWHSRH